MDELTTFVEMLDRHLVSFRITEEGIYTIIHMPGGSTFWFDTESGRLVGAK